MKKIVMIVVLAAMLLSTFAVQAATSSSKVESKALFEMMLKMSATADSNVSVGNFSHPMDGMFRTVLSMPAGEGSALVCTQSSTDTGDSVMYDCQIL